MVWRHSTFRGAHSRRQQSVRLSSQHAHHYALLLIPYHAQACRLWLLGHGFPPLCLLPVMSVPKIVVSFVSALRGVVGAVAAATATAGPQRTRSNRRSLLSKTDGAVDRDGLEETMQARGDSVRFSTPFLSHEPHDRLCTMKTCRVFRWLTDAEGR